MRGRSTAPKQARYSPSQTPCSLARDERSKIKTINARGRQTGPRAPKTGREKGKTKPASRRVAQNPATRTHAAGVISPFGRLRGHSIPWLKTANIIITKPFMNAANSALAALDIRAEHLRAEGAEKTECGAVRAASPHPPPHRGK